MPHAECPAEGIQSDENNSLSTSSAETNASQSLSSDGSHRSNGVDWHLSIQCGPLQRQSNLIDALKYAVGTNDMATMTQLYLFVTSSMFGLHRLHIFLPALTALNLDGSSLDSLRDLGAELNIKYLNISRCGLRSLDGINGMTMLQQLIADDNVIEQLLPVTDLSELQILSLKGNRIRKPEALACLSLSTKLVELNLHANPIVDRVNYRQMIGKIVPNVMILDGMSIADEQMKCAHGISSPDFSSSLTSSLSQDINVTSTFTNNSIPDNRTAHEIRPSTSVERHSEIVIMNVRKRPSTAEPFGKSHEPACNNDAIVGNMIEKVRRERKNQQKSNDNRSTSSSINTNVIHDDASDEHLRQFPHALPQSSVALEFGLVETVLETSPFFANHTASNDLTKQCDDDNIDKLLTVARKWRETSQRSRSASERS